jgi:hypothetical protein
MIILGLLLEVMDLSGADLDNVTRPRLPANAAVDDRQRSILYQVSLIITDRPSLGFR